MRNLPIRVEDLTRDALERLVVQLATTDDGDEMKVLRKFSKKPGKNDLADLDEEMHGKPNTPEVEDDDLPFDGDDELPDVPKKKKKGKE